MNILLLFLQAQTQPSFQMPSGLALLGWIIAAIVAIIYAYSGVLQNVSSGRKELVEVGEKKLSLITKEKEELEFKVKQLEDDVESLVKEKNEVEREKVILMREHHQLLEISVADLRTLKNNLKVIEELELEINRYREDKGLPLRPTNS